MVTSSEPALSAATAPLFHRLSTDAYDEFAPWPVLDPSLFLTQLSADALLEVAGGDLGCCGALSRCCRALNAVFRPMLTSLFETHFNRLCERLNPALPREELRQGLQHASTLRSTRFGDMDARILGTLLWPQPQREPESEHFSGLVSLLLFGRSLSVRGQIGDAGAAALGRAFRANGAPKLRLLSLSKNLIGNAGARALAGALPWLPELRECRLEGNKMSGDAADAFATALRLPKVAPKLSVLAIWGALPVQLLRSGGKLHSLHTSRSLSSSTEPFTIDLSNKNLVDHDVQIVTALIDGGGGTRSLVALNLSRNDLTLSGVTCVGRLILGKAGPLPPGPLDGTKALQRLDLSFNRCGGSGVDELAWMIRLGRLPALRVLELEGVRCGDCAVVELCRAICIGMPRRLQRLNVQGNELTDAGCSQLCDLLRDQGAYLFAPCEEHATDERAQKAILLLGQNPHISPLWARTLDHVARRHSVSVVGLELGKPPLESYEWDTHPRFSNDGWEDPSPARRPRYETLTEGPYAGSTVMVEEMAPSGPSADHSAGWFDFLERMHVPWWP